MDIKILFKTVAKVFSNADNENTGATVVSAPTDDLPEENAQEGTVVEEAAATETATQETEGRVE